MANTYLEITNEVLRELNEVPLTTSTFANAKGIQAFVKDMVNKAIFDIANEEPQLPFLSAGLSGATDPFYGNVTVASVAGTRWYLLKAGSSSLADDYASIDWDDFYMTTINVSGESAPYVSKGLKFLTLADWKSNYRDSENADDADGQVYGEPRYVIKSPDNEKSNVIKTDHSESTFDFEFTSGKTFSSDSIKESGSSHFLYFFSPT